MGRLSSSARLAWATALPAIAVISVIANFAQVVQSLADGRPSVLLISVGAFGAMLVIAAGWRLFLDYRAGNGGSGSAGRGIRGLLAGCTVVAVLSAVAAAGALVYASVPAAAAPAASAAPVAPVAAPAVVSPPITFADAFDTPGLDLRKWQQPEADLIRQADGSLIFEVDARGESYMYLVPLYRGEPITRIDFTVRVDRIGTPGRGGPEIVLNPNGDRPQRVVFAPGRNGATAQSLFCERPICPVGKFESFTEGPIVPVAKLTAQNPTTQNEVVPISIQVGSGKIELMVGGSWVSSAAVPEPVTSFHFALGADPAESWRVAIDDLVIR